MTEDLFGGVLARGDAAAQAADAAWLRAMLDAEAALARALARAGVVDSAAARAIGAACTPEHFDIAELSSAAAGGGNPVIPLVKRLTAVVAEADPAAARHVHFGATSQDILDTAAVLVARRACAAILRDARGPAEAARAPVEF
jgi:3-carboxy-cis,cis-muconate cycloisomerase